MSIKFNIVRDLIALGILLGILSVAIIGFSFLRIPAIILFWTGVIIWITRKVRSNKKN